MTNGYKTFGHKTLTIAIRTGLMMFAGILQADVIFYQGFDYGGSDGLMKDVASSDWSQYVVGGFDFNYIAEGLSKEGSPSTGGSGDISGIWNYTGYGESKFRQSVNIDLSSKDEFWVSQLVGMKTIPNNNNRWVSFGILVDHSNKSSAPYVIRTGMNSLDGYQFSGSVAWSGTSITGADFATVGTDVIRLVYHIQENTQPEIWVNPTGKPTLGTGQSIGETYGNLEKLVEINAVANDITMYVDEVVVGDTYEDVSAPIAASGTILVIE